MMVAAEQLRRAAELIREGRLVAFPTETVYGLGANALDEAAVDLIFQAKGRPSGNPLIVHVSSVEMARRVVREWPPEAEELARRYWPGPLTLVLPKQPEVPLRVTAGLDTVGVRMPAHAVALALIREAGVPIAGPSANRFGELSPTTAEHVRAGLGDGVDMILDGGPTQVGIESTVLSLVDPRRPVLLRPGMVGRAALEAVAGPVTTVLTAAGPAPSPGMQKRHYSPRTPLQIGGPVPDARCAYVWWSHALDCARPVRMPSSPDAYAARLYDVLHLLDAERWDCIAVEPVPDEPAWAGIADRLQRAAANHV